MSAAGIPLVGLDASTRSFDGLILCGGESRRMGSDKAFVDFAGEPLVMSPIRALHTARQVIAIGGNKTALESVGVAHQPDVAEYGGPAVAIVDGARHLGEAASPTTVVLACDLPLIDSATVLAIVDIRLRTGADVAVVVDQG